MIRKFPVLRISYRDFNSLLAYWLNLISTHSFPPAFHCKCSSHLDFSFFLFFNSFFIRLFSLSNRCLFSWNSMCYNTSSTCTPSSAWPSRNTCKAHSENSPFFPCPHIPQFASKDILSIHKFLYTYMNRGKLACWLQSMNSGTRLPEFQSQLLFLDVWFGQIASPYLISFLWGFLTAVPGPW